MLFKGLNVMLCVIEQDREQDAERSIIVEV